MDKVRFLVIGCGSRGVGMAENLAKTPGAEIVAVCDVYEDRAISVSEKLYEITKIKPVAYTDADEAFEHDIDAVFIVSSWETHIPFAIKAMEKGLKTLVEVGGAYSVQDCHRLVETYERTKTPIMMLENCCYDRSELMATAMARDGLFGEIVHCEGEYAHDLRSEITRGEENRHYRLRNYINRNCENYPTHEIGPIAKLLDINRGNRMVSLVSVASKGIGLEHYVNKTEDINPKLKGQKFNQGDVVSTIITCAGGETILIKLDTTLPRHYSRNFTVRGTEGLYEQNTHTVFFDGMEELFRTDEFYGKYMGNAKEYEDKYLCKEWRDITPEDIESGHGGMDMLILKSAVDCILEGREFPIDVYDMAAWMVITPLTELSIAQGGHPVEIPDFTHGKWIQRKRLDVVELPSHKK